MKIKHIYTIFLGCLLLLVVGCTPTSNTFYNRQFQPVSTKYNVLFNSEEAFAKGKKELEEKYKDNFYEILQVEPTAINEEIKLKGEEDPNFQRAEEKAIKTIQKHSMVYKGRQRNYKIDDAYMMLGKARYFNERFIPALEAFNHLLDSYGESNRLGDAAIWREKTNLRLGRDQIAIQNLNSLVDTLKMKRNTEVDARATLAQAYINLKEYEKAIIELEKAATLTRNKSYRGRYYFISGQLYERLNDKNSAVENYKKVVKLNWKIPRRLWIEAQGGIARNKDFSEEEKKDFLKYLSKLENRYEHKNFLDVLYYNHARLLEKDNKNKEAIALYEKSIENNKENPSLKSDTHQRLAELYFSDRKYVDAFNNYNEALKLVDENTLEHLYIKRKRDNLEQITSLENKVKQSDDLLKFEHMTEAEKIDYLKKQRDSISQNNNNEETYLSGGNLPLISFTDNQNNSGVFYFYNPTAVAYGKQNFKRKWGNRALQDNWRWVSSITNKIAHKDSISNNKDNTIISAENFLSTLPQTEEEWQTIRAERNKSLYQLGILYENKFKDHELAINRLEKLLSSQPKQDLALGANYELYKIYNLLGNAMADKYKNIILSEYPNSDYASILSGKEAVNIKEQKLKELYKFATSNLEKEEYEKVVDSINPSDFKTLKINLVPQLLLLRAKAIGRLEGIKNYEEELKEIKKNYPESSVNKEIDTILTDLASLLTEENTKKESTSNSWKIIIRNIPKENLDIIKDNYQNKLDSLSKSLKISKDLYNREETWLVIHRIKDFDTAISIIKELKPLVKGKDEDFFIISSENYRKAQVYKNIEKYLND